MLGVIRSVDKVFEDRENLGGFTVASTRDFFFQKKLCCVIFVNGEKLLKIDMNNRIPFLTLIS